jgi:surfactin synthase thioesterase subunit
MARIPLICVPFAGAGASFFHPWSALAGDKLTIVAVQPPGREWKLAAEPLRDAPQAATELLPEILGQVGTASRLALFGHSLGAVLAYEIAHQLAARGGIEVARLFVSGSPGPWTRRENRATGLDDDEFLDRVCEFAGYSHEALAYPEMRELILPTLRADVEMHENYVPSSVQPLAAPITALRGHADDLVTTEQAEEWSKATSREFTLVEVPGGHMYLTENAAGLLTLIAGEVSPR